MILPLHYVYIVLTALAMLFATRAMLVRYLNKIKLTDILKNRE